jgi:hypothetical protein
MSIMCVFGWVGHETADKGVDRVEQRRAFGFR